MEKLLEWKWKHGDEWLIEKGLFFFPINNNAYGYELPYSKLIMHVDMNFLCMKESDNNNVK